MQRTVVRIFDRVQQLEPGEQGLEPVVAVVEFRDLGFGNLGV